MSNSTKLMVDSVIVDNHPLLVNRLVVEVVVNVVNVNVGHLDVVELVDVELVVGMSNQGTCDSCVL